MKLEIKFLNNIKIWMKLIQDYQFSINPSLTSTNLNDSFIELTKLIYEDKEIYFDRKLYLHDLTTGKISFPTILIISEDELKQFINTVPQIYLKNKKNAISYLLDHSKNTLWYNGQKSQRHLIIKKLKTKCNKYNINLNELNNITETKIEEFALKIM